MKKESLALGVLAVFVLGGGVWLATAFLAGGVDSIATTEPGASPAAAPAAKVELESEGLVSEPAVAVSRAAAAPMPGEPLESADPWAEELGGLVGRVVEENGEPIPNLSVALVQVDANFILAADWEALGESPPELVIDETRSDDEGRFHLGGGYDSSFQGLALDRRGPRSTVRVLDTQLHHREVTDIGDVVLAEGCTVFGRVVDEAGNPVAGARVRFITAPPEGDSTYLQVGVQDFRDDSAVGISSVISSGVGSPVVEPPALVRAHLNDLPLPTILTDAQGEYRLEHAPLGRLAQGVDKLGLLGAIRVVTTTPGEVELEPAVLRVGQTVEGLVFDDQDEPLAGIEVMAGTEMPFGEAAILQPAGRTDAEGRFSVSGLPTTGTALACARRSPDEPWVGTLGGSSEELEIELESTLRVTVRVVDLTGEPVSGAKIELAPAPSKNSALGFVTILTRIGAAPVETRFNETEPGIYVCEKVTPGSYDILARPKGLAAARASADLKSGASELTLTCDSGQKVEVSVVDASTGAPVEQARASIVAMSPAVIMRALAVGRTGPDGRVLLGPYSPVEETGGGFFGGGGRGKQVLVQHPRYADATIELAEGVAVAEVGLQRGGEVRGRVVWGPNPPQELYMVTLENRDGVDGILEAFLPPRFGHSDLNGAFKFTNVPPGEYRIEVFERFLSKDPVTLMMAQTEPTTVHREEGLMIEAGQALDVLIDLSPSGMGQAARLAGSVVVDGRPIAGAKVNVSSSGAGGQATTDGIGEFETTGFLVVNDKVRVRIRGDVETSSGTSENMHIYSEMIAVEPQSVHRLDLDLRTTKIRFRVLDPQKVGVADAALRIRPVNAWAGNTRTSTDAAGEAEIAVIETGKYEVTASGDGFADTNVHIDFTDTDRPEVVEIEMRGAIPCGGTCDLRALDFGALEDTYLNISGEGLDEWHQLDEEDLRDDGLVAFEIDGLQAGEYKAKFWAQRQMSGEVSFELPEGGDTNLRITYQAPTEGN